MSDKFENNGLFNFSQDTIEGEVNYYDIIISIIKKLGDYTYKRQHGQIVLDESLNFKKNNIECNIKLEFENRRGISKIIDFSKEDNSCKVISYDILLIRGEMEKDYYAGQEGLKDYHFESLEIGSYHFISISPQKLISVYPPIDIDGILEVINGHINDYNNPHKVDIAKLGIYSNSEIDEKINTLSNNLHSSLLEIDRITDRLNSIDSDYEHVLNIGNEIKETISRENLVSLINSKDTFLHIQDGTERFAKPNEKSITTNFIQINPLKTYYLKLSHPLNYKLSRINYMRLKIVQYDSDGTFLGCKYASENSVNTENIEPTIKYDKFLLAEDFSEQARYIKISLTGAVLSDLKMMLIESKTPVSYRISQEDISLSKKVAIKNKLKNVLKNNDNDLIHYTPDNVYESRGFIENSDDLYNLDNWRKLNGNEKELLMNHNDDVSFTYSNTESNAIMAEIDINGLFGMEMDLDKLNYLKSIIDNISLALYYESRSEYNYRLPIKPFILKLNGEIIELELNSEGFLFELSIDDIDEYILSDKKIRYGLIFEDHDNNKSATLNVHYAAALLSMNLEQTKVANEDLTKINGNNYTEITTPYTVLLDNENLFNDYTLETNSSIIEKVEGNTFTLNTMKNKINFQVLAHSNNKSTELLEIQLKDIINGKIVYGITSIINGSNSIEHLNFSTHCNSSIKDVSKFEIIVNGSVSLSNLKVTIKAVN